jgi:hypothetical protein
MAYTTIDKPSDYFNTKLYTGNGTSQSITGVGFQPDMVWIKNRDDLYSHQLYDVIRGATKKYYPDSNSNDVTDATALNAFNSDGFSVGSNIGVNNNTNSHVAWNWLANNTTGSSNTDGTITSTVSVNTTSGFSICNVTLSGSGVQSFGHGLGVAPKFVIWKCTDTAESWFVYHSGTSSSPQNNYTRIDTADVTATVSQIWGNGTTADVVGVNVGVLGTAGQNYMAYCFAEVKGFSKIGNYLSNGSTDGNFIYTGFKPAFVITKCTNSAQGWLLQDNKRIGYNPRNNILTAHDTATENTSAFDVDFLSNGFKIRTNDFAHNGGSGAIYIYYAVAEHPLVSSTGTPCTAR